MLGLTFNTCDKMRRHHGKQSKQKSVDGNIFLSIAVSLKITSHTYAEPNIEANFRALLPKDIFSLEFDSPK